MAEAPRRVLVVKLSSMGDIVFALPCLRALRSHWPNTHISVAVNQEFAALYRAGANVDRLVIRTGTHRIRRLKTLRQALSAGVKNLPGRPDLAIDLQGTFHSAAWTYGSMARRMAGLGSPRRGWEFAMPKDFRRHAIDQNAAVLEKLGVPVTDRLPRLKADPAADEPMGAMLRQRGMPERGFVVVHPFTAWRTKEWPEERYAAVLQESPLKERAVIVTGATAELARADSLISMARHPQILNLAGQLTLEQSLALWSRAGLFIGGDTGPLHASVALGVKAVALYGPTRVEVTGPVGSDSIVIHRSVPEHHEAYRSPEGARHMPAIGTGDVIEAVERALA